MPTAHELPQWARNLRPKNVRATGSDAPEEYSPLSAPPGSVYTVVGHDAQYGRGRRNGRTIRAIVLHTTEGDSFSSSMTYNAYRPETVSSHAHVGQAGEIGYGVPELDRSWTTGRWNDEVLNVEINGRAADTEEEWRSRPRQIASLTDLLEDWCRRHEIPPVWLTAAQFAEGASPQSTTPRQGTRRGIVDHLEANLAAILLGGSPSTYDHHDIGPGLRTIVLNEVLPGVAWRLANQPAPPPEDPMANIALILPRDPRTGTTYADAFTLNPETGETLRRKGMLGQPAVVVDVDVAALEAQLGYKLTPQQ